MTVFYDFKRMRIRNKIAFLVALLLLLLSTLGLYSINASSSALKNSYGQSSVQMAQVMQGQINSMIALKVEALQNLVTRKSLISHLTASNSIFAENTAENTIKEEESSEVIKKQSKPHDFKYQFEHNNVDRNDKINARTDISKLNKIWKDTASMLWDDSHPEECRRLSEMWKRSNIRFWDSFLDVCHGHSSLPVENVIPVMKDIAENETSILLKELFIDFYEREMGRTAYSEVFLTNGYGAVTAMTNVIETYDQRDEVWWQQAMEEGMYISGVEYDNSVNGYGLSVAVRLDDTDNKALGVVKGIISSRWIMREVRAVTHLYQNSDVKVATVSGKLIYSSKPFNFYQDVSDRSFFKTIINNESYSSQSSKLSEGYSIVKEGSVDKFYAYSNVFFNEFLNIKTLQTAKLDGQINNMEWILFIGHKVKKVLAPMYLLQKRMVMVYLAVMIFSLIVALYFSRRLTRSITSVRDASVAVTDGDLTQRVKQRSSDELGELAFAFNLMTERLEHSYKALEKENIVRKKAEKAAEAANKAKSIFLANMSHELRTPLNSIIGFSQLMERDPDATDDQREKFAIILKSGMHLLALINDILEISKIESGRVELDNESFDLRQMLDDIMVMMESRAISRDIDMEMELDFKIPEFIQADQQKLRQTLINLMGNAVKFTEKGSVTLRVRMGDLTDDLIIDTFDGEASDFGKSDNNRDLLLFEVEDTGIGISKDEKHKLFQQFSQTSSGLKAAEGTGLGLSICNEYITLMGGVITVDSQPGRGSIFRFYIPVMPVEKLNINQTVSKTGKRNVLYLAPGQKSFRILIAEDNMESSTMLSELLVSAGFQVKCAVNGLEAIEMFESWRPHLIWMDIRMPVMDGYEATNRIKQSPGGSNVVIIALTASAFEEQKQHIMSSGCDDFIGKPFLASDIFQAISRHIGAKYVYTTPEKPKKNHEEYQNNKFNEDKNSQSINGQSIKVAEFHTQDSIEAQDIGKDKDSELDIDLFQKIDSNGNSVAARLKQAVRDLDMDEIDLIILEIEKNDFHTAKKLSAMAQEFHYEKIIKLLEKIQ